MKKKVIAALILFAVIVSGMVALAVGGSSGDPLISVGYLTDTFLPQILTQVKTQADQSAKADYQSAQKTLDAAAAQYAARGGLLDGDWNYCDLYERQGYKLQDVVRVAPGSGFLFLAGTASASAEGGELVDVTDGLSAASMHLQPGHRYLAGENAVVSATVLSDAAYLAPQGYYSAKRSGADALPFTDIVSTSWYYQSVRYVCGQGLFNGVSETQFSPSGSMTRAMLAAVLYRLAGSPDTQANAASFADVPAGSWYEGPVSWAAGNGIVNGMGSGLYVPDSSITREQMAVMLHRYASDYAHLSLDATGDLAAFSDAGQCSDWAEDALSWAAGAGIVTGRTDGRLDPGGTATRVEVAAMLERFASLLK